MYNKYVNVSKYIGAIWYICMYVDYKMIYVCICTLFANIGAMYNVNFMHSMHVYISFDTFVNDMIIHNSEGK